MVSILLAFAIDAWWDEVQDGRGEAAAIARILEEFDANRPEIETTADRHQRIYESGLALLDVAYGRAEPDSVFWETASRVLSQQFRTDVETYALDSYLAADESRSESASELRKRLARHRLLLEQLWQQEELARELVRGPITLAVSERFDLILIGTGTLAPELSDRLQAGRTPDAESRLLAMVREPFVRNLITARLGREWISMARSQQLLESQDALLPVLRAQGGLP